jgi:hypothetical protein
MRDLPDVKIFPSGLIDDMHKAFETVCAKLRLAPQSDKATALVVTKIVSWRRPAVEATILRSRPCGFSKPVSPSTAVTGVPRKALVPAWRSPGPRGSFRRRDPTPVNSVPVRCKSPKTFATTPRSAVPWLSARARREIETCSSTWRRRGTTSPQPGSRSLHVGSARGASQPVCCPRSSELRRGLRIACHLPFVPCDRLSKR